MSDDLLDVEAALHAEATEATGLDDFGDDYYREGLSRWLFELEQVVGGGDALRNSAKYGAHTSLVGRLYSQHGWNVRPDVLAAGLHSPVVILGVPRTGTTMMHKFLSMNQDFQVLQKWLITYPMVRPPRSTWVDIPEYRAVVAEVEGLPAHRHLTHHVGADEADECLMLVNQSFVTVMFGVRYRLPEYDNWMLSEDWRPSLQRVADNLRLIGADEPERRWLLKNPSYVLAARELFSVFPDAKVVWMHRDPREAVGSLAHMLCNSSGGDPRQRAVRELRIWSEGVRRTQEARDDHPEAFFDVDYRTLMADPLGVGNAVFDWLGMDLQPRTGALMRSWLEQNPQGKYGVHRYEPIELGASDEAVQAVFSSYMARYGLD
jgi:hypothetical protein